MTTDSTQETKSLQDDDRAMTVVLLMTVIVLGSDILIPPNLSDSVRISITLVTALVLVAVVFMLGRLLKKQMNA